jgi:hypothetical protein
MPPSTDDLPGRTPPERRPRLGGDRGPGKQPGAPGAYLAWREVPDKTEDLLTGQPIVHLTYALAGPPFASATFAKK